MNTENERESSVEENFLYAFQAMQREVFRTHLAKGWTEKSAPNDPVWRGNQLMLMVTELAESHEAIRKDLMDDKITTRKGCEVELADAIIRIMNFGTECGLDIAGALIDKAEYNKSREYMHGNKKF